MALETRARKLKSSDVDIRWLGSIDLSPLLKRLKKPIETYVWLQRERHRNLAADAEYQRKFHGFYRLRRDAA